MTHDPIRSLVFRLTAVTLALLLVMATLASRLALHYFEQALFPELRLKAMGVAEVLSREIATALDYEIPLTQVPGLTAELAKALTQHPDIAYIALEDANQGLIADYGQRPAPFADGDLARAIGGYEIITPLTHRGEIQARLVMSLDPEWVAETSMDLILEVASVILVAVLIAFEVLLLVVNLSLAPVTSLAVSETGKTHQSRQRNLVFLRLPVFLFCLTEELSRPIIPIYAQHLAPTAPWLPPDLAVSAPITLFMLIWALSQPLGARFSGWSGRHVAFGTGAMIAALGLGLAALADHLLPFVYWRCMTAVGYGLVLIAAQGLVVDHTSSENRAAGLAMFIGALLTAGVCGPVIGGIVADQVGSTATLFLGAVLAILSALSLLVLFPPQARPRKTSSGLPVMGLALAPAITKLAVDKRFTALMILSAIPAKIAATGILFCLLPLLLAHSGADKAEIGRIQMMYFLAFILAAPLVANLSDRWQIRRGFIILGGLVTLVGLGWITLSDHSWGLALAVALFGIAQAMLSTPQLTLVTQIAARIRVADITAIGWYRLLERLGGAVGPLLVVSLASVWSYRQAALGIGLLCGVSALLFALIYRGASDPASRRENPA